MSAYSSARAVTARPALCTDAEQKAKKALNCLVHDQINRSDYLIVFEDLGSDVLGLATAKDPYAQLQ